MLPEKPKIVTSGLRRGNPMDKLVSTRQILGARHCVKAGCLDASGQDGHAPLKTNPSTHVCPVNFYDSKNSMRAREKAAGQ